MLVDTDIIMRVFINKKPTYQMSINRGRNDHNLRCPCKPCGNSFLSYLSLLVKGFEEEIQPSKDCVDTTRGYTLEYLQGIFQGNHISIFSHTY